MLNHTLLGRKRVWLVTAAALLASLLLAGTAAAAKFEGSDSVYRLPSGMTIDEDLYVGASEIFIDGTVNGDLIAAGRYVEISGRVTGDVIAAAGGIRISGSVGDDVRIAGGGIDIDGTIGDDLVVAGGGAPGGGFAFPMLFGSRTVIQGVRISSQAVVGGDTVIVGGTAIIGGQIEGDLLSSMGEITLNGRVGGNANLRAERIMIGDAGQIEGTLTYTSPQTDEIRPGAAGRIERKVSASTEVRGRSPLLSLVWWLLRTVGLLLGFAGLGWLLLRIAPALLEQPAAAIAGNPVETGLWGLLVFFLFMALPLASTLIVFLVVVFWGWFPAGIVVLLALFSLLALCWIFSPLVTGLWLGRRIAATMPTLSGTLPALLTGTLILVLLGRIPCIGWLVYLVSFFLAMGGLIQQLRRPGGAGPAAQRPQVESAPA